VAAPVGADRGPIRLLVICTGNAARSVMAGFMLEHLADRRGIQLAVGTGGTHSIDGLPISARTRDALATIEALGPVAASGHRSRQVRGVDVEQSDLVVAMEASHVRYVRRYHPDAAGRTATLRRLARDLAPPPPSVGVRVAALGLDMVDIDPAEDVGDPAGGDDETYARCASELWVLCAALVDRF
jgi:protein-tyrosine-phosphatase